MLPEIYYDFIGKQGSQAGVVDTSSTTVVCGFLVPKETVVLPLWERWKQKFGFIKRVDKGWIRSDEGLTLETSAF